MQSGKACNQRKGHGRSPKGSPLHGVECPKKGRGRAPLLCMGSFRRIPRSVVPRAEKWVPDRRRWRRPGRRVGAPRSMGWFRRFLSSCHCRTSIRQSRGRPPARAAADCRSAPFCAKEESAKFVCFQGLNGSHLSRNPLKFHDLLLCMGSFLGFPNASPRTPPQAAIRNPSSRAHGEVGPGSAPMALSGTTTGGVMDHVPVSPKKHAPGTANAFPPPIATPGRGNYLLAQASRHGRPAP